MERLYRKRGDLLWVVSYSLLPDQVAADKRLRRILANLIAYLVRDGDDLERRRCLSALERQPFLLDGRQVETKLMFAWIVTRGSEGAVGWMLQLLVRNRQIRRGNGKALLAAVSRALDQEVMLTQVLAFVARRLPQTRFYRGLLWASRYVILALGFFLAYLVVWSVVHLFYLLLFSPNYYPSFTLPEFWLNQFNSLAPRILLLRVVAAYWGVYLPYRWIRRRVNEGLRPDSWWTRKATFFAMALVARLAFVGFIDVLPALAQEAHVPRIFLIVLSFGLVGGGLVASIIGIVGWLRGKYASHAPPKIAGGAGLSTKNVESDALPRISVTPLGRMSAETVSSIALNLSITEPPRPSRYKPLWLPGAVFTIFFGMGFVSFGLIGGALLGTVSAILVSVVKSFILNPLDRVREIKRGVAESAARFARKDPYFAFLGMLEKVADVGIPRWLRLAYLDAMREVSFTKQMREDLEEVYATIEPGAVRDAMTLVVERAHHEVEKARG